MRTRSHLVAFTAIVALLVWTATRLVSSSPGHSGDSMQFQFLADVYGLPHPPGAPVYVALVWVFRHLLPWLSPAAATNLFSVVAAVVMVIALARLFVRWRVPAGGTVIALFALTTTPLWLRLANVAELYVPLLAVAALALERSQAFADDGRRRDLYAVGLALGLGAGIHPTILLFGPACLVLVLQRERQPWANPHAWGALATLLGVVAAGIAWVAGLGFSEATAFRWTLFEDTQDLVDFVTASSFRKDLGTIGLGEILTSRWATHTTAVFGVASWLVPLGLLGLVPPRPRLRGLAVFSIYAANAFYVLPYDVWDVWDFVLPAQLAFVLWIGLGAARLHAWTEGSTLRRRALVWVVPVILAICQASLLAPRVEDVARAVHHPWWRDHAALALGVAGPGSVIASPSWGTSCALWYDHFVAPDRFPDREIIHAPLVDHLLAYARGDRGLLARQEDRRIPPGRNLVLLGERFAEAMLEHGLYVYDYGAEIYAVSAVEAPSLRNPASGPVPREIRPDRTRTVFDDAWGGEESWGRWMFQATGRIEVFNVPAGAVLRIGATRWDEVQDPVRVEVATDGTVIGSFVVDTPPWRPRTYEVALGVSEPTPRLTIEITTDGRHTSEGDRPRALPLTSFEITATDSARSTPN
jgi:hypothetical protein